MPKVRLHPDKPWKCPVCGARFESSSATRRHARLHHAVNIHADSATNEVMVASTKVTSESIHAERGRQRHCHTNRSARTPPPDAGNQTNHPTGSSPPFVRGIRRIAKRTVPALMDLQLSVPASLRPESPATPGECSQTPASHCSDTSRPHHVSPSATPIVPPTFDPILIPVDLNISLFNYSPLLHSSPLPKLTEVNKRASPSPPHQVSSSSSPTSPPRSSDTHLYQKHEVATELPTRLQMAFSIVNRRPTSSQVLWNQLMRTTIPSPNSSIWLKFHRRHQEVKQTLGLLASALRNGQYDISGNHPLPEPLRDWLLYFV
jgi:hypothetical protein